MSIPSLPKDGFYAKNGQLADKWRIYFETQANYLQRNISQEGFKLPQQNQENLATLNNSNSTGAMLYDSEADAPIVNVAGVNKNMTTLEQLTTDEINAIPSGQRNGRFIHDTDTDELKIGFNDEIKTVTVT